MAKSEKKATKPLVDKQDDKLPIKGNVKDASPDMQKNKEYEKKTTPTDFDDNIEEDERELGGEG